MTFDPKISCSVSFSFFIERATIQNILVCIDSSYRTIVIQTIVNESGFAVEVSLNNFATVGPQCKEIFNFEEWHHILITTNQGCCIEASVNGKEFESVHNAELRTRYNDTCDITFSNPASGWYFQGYITHLVVSSSPIWDKNHQLITNEETIFPADCIETAGNIEHFNVELKSNYKSARVMN